MKYLYFALILLLTYSCIPLRIAPNIEGEKVVSGKKFKRKLSRDYAFIFEDPKDAEEFYAYINTKFQLNHQDVGYNVPFVVNGKSYYLTYTETEISTKTLNLIPIAIDAKRENNGNDPMFEDAHISRKGTWYLAITVFDDNMKDALHPKYSEQKEVIKYLKTLKYEYLHTHNYEETLFKKKL